MALGLGVASESSPALCTPLHLVRNGQPQLVLKENQDRLDPHCKSVHLITKPGQGNEIEKQHRFKAKFIALLLYQTLSCHIRVRPIPT